MARPGAAPEEFSASVDDLVLGQLLKAVGVVGSGGEAKHLVQSGGVSVNGQVERRRGRLLAPGDLVAVRGRAFRVVDRPPG